MCLFFFLFRKRKGFFWGEEDIGELGFGINFRFCRFGIRIKLISYCILD